MQPSNSESQFKQVIPRTRKQRRDKESKETLEKSRVSLNYNQQQQHTNAIKK